MQKGCDLLNTLKCLSGPGPAEVLTQLLQTPLVAWGRGHPFQTPPHSPSIFPPSALATCRLDLGALPQIYFSNRACYLLILRILCVSYLRSSLDCPGPTLLDKSVDHCTQLKTRNIAGAGDQVNGISSGYNGYVNGGFSHVEGINVLLSHSHLRAFYFYRDNRRPRQFTAVGFDHQFVTDNNYISGTT